MKWRDSTVLDLGMVPHGEVEKIVVQLTLNQGVTAQSAYVALALMALLTTIVTPLVLRNQLVK